MWGECDLSQDCELIGFHEDSPRVGSHPHSVWNEQLMERINISEGPNVASSSKPEGKSHLLHEGFLDFSRCK